MTRRAIDLKSVRRELRALPRGALLMIAERAAELTSKIKLKSLLGDFMSLNEVDATASAFASLIDDVRQFHAASVGGEYHEECRGHSNNVYEKSRGTDAFIAEFNRLTRQCIRAAKTAPPLAVREAFELLFDLLRRIDKGNDDIIFFVDDGGPLDVWVDWKTVFPVYFRCVSQTAAAHVFAQVVDQVIRDFADFERPTHLHAARRVANPEQKAALRALPAARKR